MKYKTEVLNERDVTHGDWRVTAMVAQDIKQALTAGDSYSALSCRHREALDLIATKLARIVNGNFLELDHWKDVAGYANLIAEGETDGRTKGTDDNHGQRARAGGSVGTEGGQLSFLEQYPQEKRR